MKIAVMSDIHGNHVAFESCLDFLKEKEVDAYIFLGDYVGEFPYTEKTMELIYDLKRKSILILTLSQNAQHWKSPELLLHQKKP